MYISLSRSRLKIWLREEQVRPSRPASARYFPTLRLNLVLAHGISPAFQDDVYILCRQPLLSQSRVNRVTHLHTDGVYCREYAGTRPIILKVVRITDAVFLGITMEQIMRASLFPHQVIQKVLYQLNAHRPKVVPKKSSTSTKASID